MNQVQKKRAASVMKTRKARTRPTREFLAIRRGRLFLWAAVSPCQQVCGAVRPGCCAGLRASSDAAGGVTRPARFGRPWFPTDRGRLSKPARCSGFRQLNICTRRPTFCRASSHVHNVQTTTCLLQQAQRCAWPVEKKTGATLHECVGVRRESSSFGHAGADFGGATPMICADRGWTVQIGASGRRLGLRFGPLIGVSIAAHCRRSRRRRGRLPPRPSRPLLRRRLRSGRRRLSTHWLVTSASLWPPPVQRSRRSWFALPTATAGRLSSATPLAPSEPPQTHPGRPTSAEAGTTTMGTG